MKKIKVITPAPPEVLESQEAEDNRVDWEALEPHYRGGIRSLRDIGSEFRCSEAAIRKHAKKYKWARDLTERVKARAAEMVRMEEVRNSVREPERRATETEIVELNAVYVARTLVGHKKTIERHANLASSFLAELEGMTDLRDDFEHLGELLYAPDEKGVDKLNDIYNKVIALPGRVETFKKLSESLKIVIQLQRQAVGLSDNSNGDADKPPEVAPMNDMEVARRMAFILTRGAREQP